MYEVMKFYCVKIFLTQINLCKKIIAKIRNLFLRFKTNLFTFNMFLFALNKQKFL